MARILIVDDETVVRQLIRRVLEVDGHEVREAIQGNDALQVLREFPADLVITDLVMPDRDGVELIMALRGEARSIKVIAMSGGGDKHLTEVLEIAVPLGAVAALRKPFDIAVMVDTVNRALAA